MSECFLERLFKYRATEGRSPREDFFTEAFAGVLESRPEWAIAFAAWLTECEIESTHVATQKVAHGTDRLDMWLKARDQEDGIHLIVLENKLGARQGRDQLRRYESYLAEQGADSYTLVYVTMHERTDFEPSSEAVSFRNLHWFEVYDWLEDWIGNNDVDPGVGALTSELLKLMEAWGMEMGLGARELASAVEYKGRVQGQVLQVLDEVWEECRPDCISGSQWAYDRDGVIYSSAHVTEDGLYYEFGFDFERDDEQWNAARLHLPSAYFGIRGGDENGRYWRGLSEEWVAAPLDWPWEAHERVRKLATLETKGASLQEGYVQFFLSSLEQARAAIRS